MFEKFRKGVKTNRDQKEEIHNIKDRRIRLDKFTFSEYIT